MKKDLIAAAVTARTLAYAPYSKYLVGAALITKQGEIITGSNVENASYGLTSCAERNAVFKAVTEGKTEFTAIAIVTKDGGLPCGACRQVLNEFSPDMQVIIAHEHGAVLQEVNLSELLPYAFGPTNLRDAQ
jgi:cytidine deaminase